MRVFGGGPLSESLLYSIRVLGIALVAHHISNLVIIKMGQSQINLNLPDQGDCFGAPPIGAPPIGGMGLGPSAFASARTNWIAPPQSESC